MLAYRNTKQPEYFLLSVSIFSRKYSSQLRRNMQIWYDPLFSKLEIFICTIYRTSHGETRGYSPIVESQLENSSKLLSQKVVARPSIPFSSASARRTLQNSPWEVERNTSIVTGTGQRVVFLHLRSLQRFLQEFLFLKLSIKRNNRSWSNVGWSCIYVYVEYVVKLHHKCFSVLFCFSFFFSLSRKYYPLHKEKDLCSIACAIILYVYIFISIQSSLIITSL